MAISVVSRLDIVVFGTDTMYTKCSIQLVQCTQDDKSTLDDISMIWGLSQLSGVRGATEISRS